MTIMSPSGAVGAAVDDADAHLQRLEQALPAAAGVIERERFRHARPSWPVWPQPALSMLVGPAAVTLGYLDQRWLHRFETTVAALHRLSGAVGGPGGGPSGLHLLVERAGRLGMRGWGPVSAGTSCRLLRADDGWVAVNLPRPEDLEAVPALVETGDGGADAWRLLRDAVARRSVHELVERAGLLGLAVAAVPDVGAGPVWPVSPLVRPAGTAALGVPTVVDLSSLWAGPLCGWYLARAGARVIKVESSSRPDGARRGTPGFFRRLNGAKQLVELALDTSGGVAQLRELVDEADIIIEGSRPRALRSFGIEAEDAVARGAIWCSITGYGRAPATEHRVAFGDDAAAAGGLITYVGGEPWFIGDAAADPVSGVSAALGVFALWHAGRAGMVDVSMLDAVRALTGGVPVASR